MVHKSPNAVDVATPKEKQEDGLQNTETSQDSSLMQHNVKEKTPMCLVNELARFNKVSHFAQVFVKQVSVLVIGSKCTQNVMNCHVDM